MWHQSLTVFFGPTPAIQARLLAEWCANMQNGLPIYGYPTNPQAFFYIAVNFPWNPTYPELFGSFGLDFSDCHYALPDDRDQDPQTWKDEEALKRTREIFADLHKRYNLKGRLVIVESASPTLVHGSPVNPRDVARTMLFYRGLIRRYQITLIFVCGTAKPRLDARNAYLLPEHDVYGSCEFSRHADLSIWVKENKGPIHIGWKPHDPPRWEAAFKFDVEQNRYVETMDEAKMPKMLIKALPLLDLIPDDGIQYMKLVRLGAERLHLDPRTIERYLDYLRGYDPPFVRGEGQRLVRCKVS
jgi:hypothetical protein